MKNRIKNLLVLFFLAIGFAPAVFAADQMPSSQTAPPPEAKKSNSADMMDKMDKKAHSKTMTKGAMAAGEKVSINSGTKEELEKLPGIGPAKADAIIKARPFKSVDDITKVKGIKKDVFTKIKNNIVL